MGLLSFKCKCKLNQAVSFGIQEYTMKYNEYFYQKGEVWVDLFLAVLYVYAEDEMLERKWKLGWLWQYVYRGYSSWNICNALWDRFF